MFANQDGFIQSVRRIDKPVFLNLRVAGKSRIPMQTSFSGFNFDSDCNGCGNQPRSKQTAEDSRLDETPIAVPIHHPVLEYCPRTAYFKGEAKNLEE